MYVLRGVVVRATERRDAKMNNYPHIQNYCEVTPRVKRYKYNPGTKRMYTNEFQIAIAKAETVGEVIKAFRKASATWGLFNDAPELHDKVMKAAKSKEPI